MEKRRLSSGAMCAEDAMNGPLLDRREFMAVAGGIAAASLMPAARGQGAMAALG
jgi:hypothetical protein